MAEKSDFFKSISGDRDLSADRFAERFRDFMVEGIFVDNGSAISTELEVTSIGGLSVQINLGTAEIQGYFYKIYSAVESLALSAGDPTNDRIDRIILELNINDAERTISVKVLEGTPAGTPTAPALTRDLTVSGIYQISLAQIDVVSGASSIAPGDITDERSDDTVCGLADINLNISTIGARVTVDDSGFTKLTKTNSQELFDEIDDIVVGTTTGVQDKLLRTGTNGLITAGSAGFTSTASAIELLKNTNLTGNLVATGNLIAGSDNVGSIGLGTSSPSAFLAGNIIHNKVTGDFYPVNVFERVSGSSYTNRKWSNYLDSVGDLVWYDETATSVLLKLAKANGLITLSGDLLQSGAQKITAGSNGITTTGNAIVGSDNIGNVGVGTTSPTAFLTGNVVHNRVTGDSVYPLFSLERTGATSFTNRKWSNYLDSVGDLVWYDETGTAVMFKSKKSTGDFEITGSVSVGGTGVTASSSIQSTSTTAFSVKNNTGTAYFTVDTSNGLVKSSPITIENATSESIKYDRGEIAGENFLQGINGTGSNSELTWYKDNATPTVLMSLTLGFDGLKVKNRIHSEAGIFRLTELTSAGQEPTTITGNAFLYVDLNGNFKIKFGNGTVKTITTDA